MRKKIKGIEVNAPRVDLPLLHISPKLICTEGKLHR